MCDLTRGKRNKKHFEILHLICHVSCHLNRVLRSDWSCREYCEVLIDWLDVDILFQFLNEAKQLFCRCVACRLNMVPVRFSYVSFLACFKVFLSFLNFSPSSGLPVVLSWLKAICFCLSLRLTLYFIHGVWFTDTIVRWDVLFIALLIPSLNCDNTSLADLHLLVMLFVRLSLSCHFTNN